MKTYAVIQWERISGKQNTSAPTGDCLPPKTETDFGGSYEMTTYFPFAEKTYGMVPVTAEQLWGCVSAYEWTWTDEENAFVTVTTGLGGESEQINATVTAQVTTEPQIGVAGEKLATATATVDGVELTATKTFEIPALEEPDDPDDPSDPTDPTDPTDPADANGTKCPECGKVHGKDVIGVLTAILHHLIYFIKSLSSRLFK